MLPQATKWQIEQNQLNEKYKNMAALTLEETKKKLLAWTDFLGGDIADTSAIKKATSMADLEAILDKHRNYLDDVLNDAQSHLDRFKESIGLCKYQYED